MNREQRERLVDEVLDRALGSQVVEPRPGLEQRILANLPANSERPPWWQWLWIPALAAAAVLAIVIGMRMMQKETPAPQQVRKTVEEPKPEVAVRPETAVHKEEPRIRRRRITVSAPRATVAKAEPPPRQSVFPSPTPPTAEEYALMRMLQNRPAQVAVVAQDQAAERAKVLKFFETGIGAEPAPDPAQSMR